ncbi:YlxR family protein [Actinomyces sp. B33]|uniref:YlxR family protein n=1 Tax=Actinomyces sp. B33 TaxID=2942131 RepID=UPI0023428522|nr:YlxR family protein [Actinomyces sp. B33]MDC4233019.1 YlxR family protein [Actinomyces sp. B33]
MPHPEHLPTPPPVTDGPVRTCTGCGRRQARSELIRVVASPGGPIQVDPRRDLPGRGAWVHPDPACIGRARARGALARSLKTGSPIGDEVWAELEEIARTAARPAPTDE